MVLNIDVLHGGLNLYNNGFSGGLVAMMIIPLLDLSQQLRNKRAIDQVEDELLDKAGIVLHTIRQEEEPTSEEPQTTRLSLPRDN